MDVGVDAGVAATAAGTLEVRPTTRVRLIADRITRSLKSNNSAADRAVAKGVGYATLGRAVTESIRVARLLIIARLLAPEDMGTFGIAASVLALLDAVTEPGLQLALVRKPGRIDGHLDTAFTLQFIRGCILVVILIAAAPAVAQFFAVPAAASVVRALALVVLLRAVTNPAIVHLKRELRFGALALLNLWEPLVGLVVLIPAALVWRNVSALLVALIAGQVAKTVASYVVQPYRPRLRIDRSVASELSSFGKWMVASQIVVYLAINADNIYVGKSFGAAALGIYALAFKITELPTTLVTRGLSESILMVFSRLQEDKPALALFYRKMMIRLTLITFAICGGIFAGAGAIQALLLTEKWTGIVPLIRVLVFGAFMRALLSVTMWLSVAVGRPQVNFAVNASRLAIMAVAIIPLSRWLGLTGVALSVNLGLAGALIICVVSARRDLQ